MKNSSSFYYNDFGTYLSGIFNTKVQKISIDGGFTCPNRDGTLGVGGCTYCNNQTFNPAYCHRAKSVREQMSEGINFFARKYPSMRYLAYFQAYTNTYDSIETVITRYREALTVDGTDGIVIGTRPDCMSNELLDYLQQLSLSTYVLVEYGVESVNDVILKRINRGHDFCASIDTIVRTAERGIAVGAHIILGLPGETRQQMLQGARELSKLPLTTIKLHQLQLIRGTVMAVEFEQRPEDFHFFELNEYIDLVVDYIEILRPDIVIERFVSQSPKELLIAPDWGCKNYEIVELVKRRMRERMTYQGRKYIAY